MLMWYRWSFIKNALCEFYYLDEVSYSFLLSLVECYFGWGSVNIWFCLGVLVRGEFEEYIQYYLLLNYKLNSKPIQWKMVYVITIIKILFLKYAEA